MHFCDWKAFWTVGKTLNWRFSSDLGWGCILLLSTSEASAGLSCWEPELRIELSAQAREGGVGNVLSLQRSEGSGAARLGILHWTEQNARSPSHFL